MSSEKKELAICVRGVSKVYEIYDTPSHRLKQFLIPKLQSLFGKNKKKYYKDFHALSDISFDVYKGQTFGIIGKNGSGKSTLLQIICGTLHPSAGEVQVTGRVAALLELGSGFNPEFTGRENVYFNASILGQEESITRSKFSEIEKFADIGDFIDQPVKTYSSGMLVRLAFAVIAHVDADILVIDEALAVGDAFFTQKCMRFLRDFMKKGTVLFVSHDLGAVKNLCSDAIWINKGCLKYNGDSRIASDLYIEELFGYDKPKYTEKERVNKITDSNYKNIRNNDINGGDLHIVKNSVKKEYLDVRSDFINKSILRNDIKIFDFDFNAKSYESGSAFIDDVGFYNLDGNKIAYIVGGERVILQVRVRVNEEIKSPIIGFYIKDRLGQNLFGDNTWLSYCDDVKTVPEGDYVLARFIFYMPRLHVGDYSITVAFAQGTQDSFVQHHWIHDALHFVSQTSSVAGGLIGIPMQEISLEIFSENKYFNKG